MAGFFGPGGLTGRSEPGLDPQLMQALLSQFPGLEGLRGQGGGQGQPPKSLGSLGYQWGGPTLYSGQGQNSFSLSPFEGAGGSSPESITAGLASGTFGKSASQQSPFGGQAFGQQSQGSLLSLPSLSLPMAQVAASQGGFSGDMMGSGADSGADAGGGGMSIGAGDILGGAQNVLNMFGGDALGQQTMTPGTTEAMAQQRAGERDMTNLGGSFAQPNALSSLLAQPAPISSFLQAPDLSGSTFSMGAPANFGVMSPQPTQTLTPGTTFEMPGEGTTMLAPGGASAKDVLGAGSGGGPGLSSLLGDIAGATGSGLLGLGGAYNVAQGIQGLMQPDGNSAQSLLQIGGGGVATYQALQQLSAQFPELAKSLIGGELPTITSGIMQLANGVGGEHVESLVQAIDSLVNGSQAATGAAGGVSGGLSLGGAGAGAVAALLGILAQQTGSTELAMAAEALGGAASAVTTGASIASAVGAGASAGIGAAAGAAFAPVAVMTLAMSIANMIEPGSAPEISDIWMNGGQMDPYLSFVPELMQNVGQQDIGFSVLGQALPYVQSKEELGQLINTYKNYVQTTTGIQFDDAMDNPYVLDAIPGVGPVTHGQQTQSVDYGKQQTGLQNIINEMLNVLPGQQITDPGYTGEMFLQGGTGPSGEVGRRLWQQFPEIRLGAADRNIPDAFASQDPATGFPTSAQWLYQGDGQPYYSVSPQDYNNAINAGTIGRRPEWDPATGQWVQVGGQRPLAPSDYFQQSPYWGTVGQNMFNASPQGQQAQQFLQQLQQFQQGMGQLNQQAPQLLQGFQSSAQGAQLPPEMVMAGGGGSMPGGGGGIDLKKLLRELGYLGPVDGGFAQGGRVPRTGDYQLHQGEVVLPKALFERMTQLKPQNEQAFQKWYKDIASRVGLAKNPDDPLHFYDYRGAWQAGAGEPGADTHFNSRYKVLGHPNQYVDDMDTRSGLPINTPKFSLGFPG